MLLPLRLKEELEKADFKISANDNSICMEKYTDFGQDCIICDGDYENLSELEYGLHEYYGDFDIDEETALWIGADGHGKNGAPYHITDIVKDMEQYHDFIYEAFTIIHNFIYANPVLCGII